MKIEDIIKAGYRPTRIRGKPIKDCYIEVETGVLLLVIPEHRRGDAEEIYVSLQKDHEELSMEFSILANFNAETAEALLLSEAAPLLREDINRNGIKSLQKIREDRARKKALFREGSCGSDLI